MRLAEALAAEDRSEVDVAARRVYVRVSGRGEELRKRHPGDRPMRDARVAETVEREVLMLVVVAIELDARASRLREIDVAEFLRAVLDRRHMHERTGRRVLVVQEAACVLDLGARDERAEERFELRMDRHLTYARARLRLRALRVALLLLATDVDDAVIEVDVTGDEAAAFALTETGVESDGVELAAVHGHVLAREERDHLARVERGLFAIGPLVGRSDVARRIVLGIAHA